MKIRVFHVGDGDCLLLTATKATAGGNDTEHHMLVDGGRKEPFRDNARSEIYALDQIDLIYVSHIDDDHISGIVGVTEDMVTWRVHNRRVATGQNTKRPSFDEPPPVKEIWHNSLFELVGTDLEPQIPGVLSATAGLLASSASDEQRELASRLDDLATGERSSMELSRRISPRQLAIKRNRPKDETMVRGRFKKNKVGPFTVQVIGPTQAAIDNLEDRWRTWLQENREAMRRLQAEMLDDEDRLGLTASDVARPLLVSALGEGSITEPNLASLMLFVSAGRGSSILLTGDGSSEDVLEGLAHYKRLDNEGRIHVQALKVQHHGAEANVTEDFVDRVTADHYIFCGNGAHHNPEKTVVEAFAHARLGVDRPAIEPDRDFKFWFSSRKTTAGLTKARVKHMRMIEDLVSDIRKDHDPDNRFSFEFLKEGHHTIEI